MKKILILIFFIIVSNYFAQEKFVSLIDTKKNEPMLVGEINQEALLHSAYYSWFNEESEYYNVDTLTLAEVKNHLENIEIEIIMGTWCSDSRREVPHFLKILNYLKYDNANLRITAVDRTKKALNDRINKYNIELVPTFIIINYGNEIGRIVEAPIESLEIDLKKIIKKEKD